MRRRDAATTTDSILFARRFRKATSLTIPDVIRAAPITPRARCEIRGASPCYRPLSRPNSAVGRSQAAGFTGISAIAH